MAEVEETLKRLQSQKGVQGIIVVNTEGIPIKSTMDNPTTTQYANLMHNFILKARSTVREIDPQNDLTFLRIRSKKNEIMVAPGKGSLRSPLGAGPQHVWSVRKAWHMVSPEGPGVLGDWSSQPRPHILAHGDSRPQESWAVSWGGGHASPPHRLPLPCCGETQGTFRTEV